MAEVASVDIVSHKEEVLRAAKNQIYEWLEAVGEDAAAVAANKCPVDTGLLKNSITSAVVRSENAVYIGTDVEYAIYHEFGTGEFASGRSNAKKIPWAFRGRDGKWHYTKGVVPRHMLRFGITAHKLTYKWMLEDYLKG